jgi:hypothetical protein
MSSWKVGGLGLEAFICDRANSQQIRRPGLRLVPGSVWIWVNEPRYSLFRYLLSALI